MKNIYIYGTGSKALLNLPALALEYKILGFVDSDVNKQGGFFLGKPIVHLSSLSEIEYNYIIVASSFSTTIFENLKAHNIQNAIDVDTLPSILEVASEYTTILGNIQESSLPSLNTLPRKYIEGTILLENREILLEQLPVDSIGVELGVAAGDFSERIIAKLNPKKLHLVDVWDSERYGEHLFQSVKHKFRDAIESGSCQIHRNTSLKAVDDFEDNYFDWVYIDTTHGYATTKKELTAYNTKIKPGGIIAGHDYCMGNWSKRSRYGVIEAVYEFCKTYEWRIKYITMDIDERQSFALERV